MMRILRVVAAIVGALACGVEAHASRVRAAGGTTRNTVIIWDGSRDVPVSAGDGVVTTLDTLGLPSLDAFAIVVSEGAPIPSFVPQLDVRGVKLILRSDALESACSAVPAPQFCARRGRLDALMFPASLGVLNVTVFSELTKEEIGALPGVALDLVRGEEHNVWRLAALEQSVLAEMTAVLGASAIKMCLDSDVHEPSGWTRRVMLETFNLPRPTANRWQLRSPESLSGVAGDALRTIAVHPTDPLTLLASTTAGVFSTSNAGITWSASSTGLPPSPVSVIGGPWFTSWYAVVGGSPAPVFKRSAFSEWVAADTGLRRAGSDAPLYPTSLVLDPSRLDRVYAATDEGLFRTDGADWSKVTADTAAVGALAVRGGKSSISVDSIFYSLGGSLYISKDAGATSTSVGLTGVTLLALVPGSSTTVYAAVTIAASESCPASSSLMRSTDDGVTWAAINDGLPRGLAECSNRPSFDVRTLITDPDAPSRVYALTAPDAASAPDGIYLTSDGGDTWTRVPPLPTSRPVAIAARGGALYAGAAPGAVYSIHLVQPVVSSVTPSTAWAAGALVTITGEGFASGASVHFDGIAASDVQVQSPTTIVAKIPSHAPGQVTVRVTNLDGVAGALRSAFTYSAPSSMALDKSSLRFSATMRGTTIVRRTGRQTVRMTQLGPGPITWTAVSNRSWLQVSPSSGTGTATLVLSIAAVPGLPTEGSLQASVTIALSGALHTLAPIDVMLTVMRESTSRAPRGAIDTPLPNTVGVNGSIGVTGWAVDDVEVWAIRILRDPVPGEPSGSPVFIGRATLVEGARPDVQTAFPAYPKNSMAGWGYLLLTNMLPNRGNGTFRLYAIADDADGHSTLLGSRTMTCDNAHAANPFGAIDTPGQGETVSGIFNNFGWVLSPGTRRSDPLHGGDVTVAIDGRLVGHPVGWTERSDLTALFPAGQFSGIRNALGLYTFDTTTLENGVHTIAWIVKDNADGAAGIGSRYFTVSNGADLTLEPSKNTGLPSSGGTAARDLAGPPSRASTITGRRGFSLDAPFRTYRADANGVITIQSEELDRIELLVGEVSAAYLQSPDARQLPLPIGSHLDATSGTFTWQPGVGFVGAYDLIFERPADGGIHVRIVLNPKGSGRVGPQVVIDVPSATGAGRVFRAGAPILVAGWAADLDSGVDSGVDTVHVWAYPVIERGSRHGDPLFIGVAAYGGARPDVAAVYGDRFKKSGYGIVVDNLDPGTYDIAVFAYSTVRGGFVPAKTVRLTVR